MVPMTEESKQWENWKLRQGGIKDNCLHKISLLSCMYHDKQKKLREYQAWWVKYRSSSEPHHVIGVCKHQEKTVSMGREEGKSLEAQRCSLQEHETKLQQEMAQVSKHVNGNYIHFCTVQRYVSNCSARVTSEKNLWAVEKKVITGPLKTCRCIKK